MTTGVRGALRASKAKPFTALLLVASLLAGVVGVTTVASASTDFTSPEPTGGTGGIPLIRNDSLPITVSRGAFNYTQSTATSAFARQSLLSLALAGQGCKGDNPAGQNLTPKTVVTVTGPGGVVYTWTSPVLDFSVGGFLSGNKPLAEPQVANNTNYRGDAPASSPPFDNARGYNPYPTAIPPISLAGKPSGVYTITTETFNMVRTGAGSVPAATACKVGTPNLAPSGTAFLATFTPGPVVEVDKFEYRPWQEQFTDLLGNGQVQFNTTPAESAFSFTSPAVQSSIQPGGMTFFSMPEVETFTLPEDPAACAANAAACLPTIATQCNPSAGCVPRIVLISRSTPATSTSPASNLTGVFDLETRAFIAQANIGGSQRTLLSLGTQLDGIYGDLLEQLGAQAAAQGVDLGTLLRTAVRVRLGGNEIKLSLLRGLQIDPTTAANGVQIVSDLSVQAGLILYIGGGTSTAYDADGTGPIAPTCGTALSANNGPELAYDMPPGVAGLRVSKLPVTLPTTQVPITIPPIPGVPASALSLATSLGGQVWHIETVNGAVGTALTALGTTTQPDAPSGLPVWVPLQDGVAPAAAATKYEFVGTPLFVSNTPIGPILGNCTTVSIFLGAGVGIANNPLPLKLGDLIRLTHGLNPVLAPLLGPVVAVVADLTGQVFTNPTIVELLTAVNEAIGSAPPVPTP